MHLRLKRGKVVKGAAAESGGGAAVVGAGGGERRRGFEYRIGTQCVSKRH